MPSILHTARLPHREKSVLKIKSPGGNRPRVDGDDLHRDSDRWVKLIDRRGDWYGERVLDAETGEIVRDCAERLSQHRGRGSANHRSWKE